MLILGIETSCDETAVALVERGENNRVVLEKIKSQIPLHSGFGGVVPEIASRTHYEVIDELTRSVLEETAVTLSDIDAVAVTQGPGLIGSLLVGLSFAKGVAFANHKPLIPVDHIQAHIESAFITNRRYDTPWWHWSPPGGTPRCFTNHPGLRPNSLPRQGMMRSAK